VTVEVKQNLGRQLSQKSKLLTDFYICKLKKTNMKKLSNI